ncbi:hypothetical protein Bca52824_022933 [Brassica carinata]|uniref:Ubiquitin-like protease family profile domain-containing protein n=1 Tax=Brassica carinata TaxID=52824 RepID=A0A8X7VHN3_BRACI|nr:hypothetical protein Bca52824_022933 [Brassica carinata]
MATQGVEGLSQASYVPDFDPSQTNKEDDWWTPMTSVRGSKAKPLKKEKDTAPPSQWKKWYKGKTTRIVSAGKWLGNEEMDAFMFIWRVNTTLHRWTPSRVAFMSAIGEIPSHGRTDQVWGVNVDRLYFPLFVNGNHWVGVCVNIIEKKVEVFDCSRGKNRQYVEKFIAMIPRIVKAVGPLERRKPTPLRYSIMDVPMKMRLNKSCCDCGASGSSTWNAICLVSTSV